MCDKSDAENESPPPLSPCGGGSAEQPRVKRIQVKNACVNCQRACKKCDSGRPCKRCVRQGLGDSCEDSKRKPRQRGIKRGPYKKRKQPGDAASPSPHVPTIAPVAAATAMPPAPGALLYGGFSPESSDGSPPRLWKPVLPRSGPLQRPPGPPSSLVILSDVALTDPRYSPSPIPTPLRRTATPCRSIPLSTARFDAAHRTPPWTPIKTDGRAAAAAHSRSLTPDSEPQQVRRLSQLLDSTSIGAARPG
ncbi:hypothetical protein IWQ57_001090 [Coemansia nantahalensis]|uniref:Uncharacterized protein n=1 Tax=Coemansia nantahalensis TaxID=2789366 RepID=A0ACC1K5V6_9FUNG|nr:hypothetical protein IWQ57_001090 [Coemansia nantahalensis]